MKHAKINRWLKITITTIAILSIIAVTFWTFSHANKKTRFKLTVNTPAPTAFTDTNIAPLSETNNLPTINNNRQISQQDTLNIYFNAQKHYADALRPELTDAQIMQYVKISPFIRGKWSKFDENNIYFTPEEDWPSDTKFTIKFDKKLFLPDTKINSYKTEFTTPKIATAINSFNTYINNDTNQQMNAVAILSFNYPINTKNFQDKISMSLDGKKLKFETNFDKYHRTAIITSEPITVSNTTQDVRIKINKIPSIYGNDATQKTTGTTTVAASDNIFKISDISTTVADDTKGNPTQLIVITTTAPATQDSDWKKHISVYLLPEHAKKPENIDTTAPHIWKLDEITPEVLAQSTKIDINKIDFSTPHGIYQYAFSYNIPNAENRYLYINVEPGLKSNGNFVMHNGASNLLIVAYPQKSLTITGDGALLALGGDRKIAITARGGIGTAYINLSKIKESEINHLITQTYNIFSDLRFKDWDFNAYDMSPVFTKKISFSDTTATHVNYAAVDLSEYLDRTNTDKTGIFIVKVGTSEQNAQHGDSRLILLTNLGIIRKVNLNNTSTVFVSDIYNGTPAPDIEISVLGRNGNAIWAGRTDTSGIAHIPNLPSNEYNNEKEPIAIVAKKENDVSFIPYRYSDKTYVTYSKFDTDGTYNTPSTPLNAYLFSDRGIYRPGENIIISGIIKNKSFKSTAGIPVKIVVNDSQDRTIHEQIFSLTSDGMFDISFDISENAPLGTYNSYVYSLNTQNTPLDTLGTMTFAVQEFVPDTMKITAAMDAPESLNWLPIDNLSANITLYNLFGTPAVGNKITANARIEPIKYNFSQYPEYIFTPNFYPDTDMSNFASSRNKTFDLQVPATETNDKGIAVLSISPTTQIPYGTYKLTLDVTGYQKSSGQNVQTTITTRVSNAAHLVGYHTKSNLDYLNRNDEHYIQVVALGPNAKPINLDKLTMKIIRRDTRTSLIKDTNGYYKYQTTTQDTVVSTTNQSIPESGKNIKLDTTNAGTYFLQISDSDKNILTNIKYTIISSENTALNNNTDSEIKLKLNSDEYKPGDTISINITAPYIGSGLITIERDQVYASKWFKANGTTTTQYIKIPDNFEGNGYINVSYVRDINSRDIFTSPYAYSVAPFKVNLGSRKIDIDLNAPEIISNDKLTIKYSTNQSARIMIFAVNTGILQVAQYKIPNPLAHFFKKSALTVETYQILSLLMPEYKILREYAKTGGSDELYAMTSADFAASKKLTNPFKRFGDKAVAFYSGILETTADTTQEITFDIPESFDGTLQIFAIAANNNAIGAANTQTVVQNPVIITTNAPFAVSPGDTFDITTLVSTTKFENTENQIETINLDIQTTNNLQPQTATTIKSNASSNIDNSYSTTLTATNNLGEAKITTNVNLQENNNTIANRKSETNISVRPTTVFSTKIQSDYLDDTNTTLNNFYIDLYPQYSTKKIYFSHNQSVLSRPLFEYLKEYKHDCTEQIVSKAMPYAVAPNTPLLGTTYNESAEKIATTIKNLKNRQKPNGSFLAWANNDVTQPEHEYNSNTAIITAYTALFLNNARDNGFSVPSDMLSRAIYYLRTYITTQINNDTDAFAHAFAAYIITRNEYITTNYIAHINEYTQQNISNWEQTIIGTLIATSYKIMKQDSIANAIISKYNPKKSRKLSDFATPVVNNGLHTYLANKYFAYQAIDKTAQEYINNGKYTSLASAIITMALNSESDTNDVAPNLSITNGSENIPVTQIGNILTATIPNNANKLKIKCEKCDKDYPVIYTIIQQGYPTHTRAQSNGIRITRQYLDSNNNEIKSGNIGDTITVKITAHPYGNTEKVPNAVITDLLPGGMIINPNSMDGNVDFFESHEDRMLIYTDIDHQGIQFTYTTTLSSIGDFNVPAIHAESMYNPAINATGKASKFTITNANTQ